MQKYTVIRDGINEDFDIHGKLIYKWDDPLWCTPLDGDDCRILLCAVVGKAVDDERRHKHEMKAGALALHELYITSTKMMRYDCEVLGLDYNAIMRELGR